MENMKYKYSTTTNKNKNTQNFLSKYKIRIYVLDQNSVFCYNFKSHYLRKSRIARHSSKNRIFLLFCQNIPFSDLI